VNSDVEYGEVDVEAWPEGEAYRTGRILDTGSFLCRRTYQWMRGACGKGTYGPTRSTFGRSVGGLVLRCRWRSERPPEEGTADRERARRAMDGA
jgi:hypothetical protein